MFQALILEPLDVLGAALMRVTGFVARLAPVGVFAIAASLKGLAGVVEQELGIKTSIADPVAGMELAPSVAVSALKRNAPSRPCAEPRLAIPIGRGSRCAPPRPSVAVWSAARQRSPSGTRPS